MRQAQEKLRIGDEWVHEHAQYGDMRVIDQWPNGPTELRAQIMLRPGERPSWLAEGAPVELDAAGLRWSGTLAEPEWDSGEFVADGWCRQADAGALDASGQATNDPAVAIAQAKARGAIDFSLAPGVTIPALPGAALEVNTIMALLDQSGLENGFRWRIGVDRLLRTGVDATEPTLWVLPSVVELGVSAAAAVDCVVAEYDAGAGVTARVTATSGTRRRERLVDLRDAGVLTASRAQQIVDELLERAGAGRPLFLSGFEVAPGQVVDEHDAEVDLSLPMCGQMIELPGLSDPRGGGATRMVIGETQWMPGDEPRLQINPMDLSLGGDDFAELVESYGGKVVL